MKSYGLDLQHSDENSRTDRLESGTSFPTDIAAGSIFYLLPNENGLAPGIYTFDGFAWNPGGDISSVNAGFGLLGGGLAGDITLELDPSVVLSTDDLRLHDSNKVVVKKNPGPGEFSSIAAAIDSITDNDIEKTYVVEVSAGVFEEPQIVCKPFVFIRGAGQGSTIIYAIDPNDHLIIGSERAAITGCTLTNATGENIAAIYYEHPTGNTQLAFMAEHIKFGTNHTHVYCRSGNMIVNNSTFGSVFQFVRGFVVEDLGDRDARITVRNSATSGMKAPFPEVMFRANGLKSQILIVGTVCRATATLLGTAAEPLTVMNRGETISISNPSDEVTGLHLLNGGKCRVLALSLVGFRKGVWLENAGAAPYVSCVGVNLEANEQDLVIEHPGSMGSFTGIAARSKCTVHDDAAMTILYSDIEEPGTIGVGPLYQGRNHAKLVDVSPLLTRGTPLGVLDGGILSKGTGLQINVTAGSGYAKNGIDLVHLAWPDTTLTVPAGTSDYIYVDLSNTVKRSTAQPDTVSSIILGRYLAGASSILMLGSQGSINISDFHPNMDRLHKLAIGPLYVSGSIVTENATTPRAIDVTAGQYFYSAMERKPAARTAATILTIVRVNGVPSIQLLTQVSNSQYDNGTNLTMAPAGYFMKHALYTNGDGENVGFVLAHATAAYATLAEALEAPLPVPLIKPDGSPMLAALITQQGVDNFVQIIDQRPRMGVSGSASAGVNNHGDLTGLEADDHTQYFRADGTRQMVGDIDMNGHALINVANVNGLDMTTHASRHVPNGVDPLPTATAVSISNASTNQAGIANSFARSDHTHAITGFQPTNASLTSIGGLAGTAGLLRKTAANTYTLDTASYLTANQTITVSGDATGSGSTAITLTLANSGVTAGTYPKVTVDVKGRVTSGGNLTLSDVVNGLGYTPYNANNPSGFITANQNISITGDATGSGSTSIALTLANSGVTAGKYREVTVDAKGRVSAGSYDGVLEYYRGSVPVTSGTTAIAFDNTPPTSTEGTQVFSVTVTRKAAGSDYVIEFGGMIASGTNSRGITVALFRGTTLLGFVTNWMGSSNSPQSFYVRAVDVAPAGAVGSTLTYSARIGISTSGNSWYLGRSSSATMGGVNPSSYTITEIL